jgi:hypothetical protein
MSIFNERIGAEMPNHFLLVALLCGKRVIVVNDYQIHPE